MEIKEIPVLGRDINNASGLSDDYPDGELKTLEDAKAIAISGKYNISVRDVYIEALKNKIVPLRYVRNLPSLTIKEQLVLCRSKAAVVGSGGLGGQVVLMLARFGIGELLVVDHDVFDETNLNRQALCTMDVLGKYKAETAKKTVESINPGIKVTAENIRLEPSNAVKILGGSDVIIDALDNIPDRFLLEETAHKIGIPFVHGAVAGFDGQVMTLFPGDTGMESLYGRLKKDKKPESMTGGFISVPAVTPTITGAYQAMEAIKILLERSNVLRNQMLYMDMINSESKKLRFGK